MPKSEKGCLGRHLTDLMLRENRETRKVETALQNSALNPRPGARVGMEREHLASHVNTEEFGQGQPESRGLSKT